MKPRRAKLSLGFKYFSHQSFDHIGLQKRNQNIQLEHNPNTGK